MSDLAFCPDCGRNLRKHEPRTIGALVFDPHGEVSWRGRKIKPTPGERLILRALVLAMPRPVGVGALLDQMSSEAGTNVIAVLVSRLRRKFRAVGAPDFIINEWGRGYRLDMTALTSFVRSRTEAAVSRDAPRTTDGGSSFVAASHHDGSNAR